MTKHELNEFLTIQGLQKTDLTVDDSSIYDCSFWQTKYEGVFVTDYDVAQKDIHKLKNVLKIFGKKNGYFTEVCFSIELLKYAPETLAKAVEEVNNELNAATA